MAGKAFIGVPIFRQDVDLVDVSSSYEKKGLRKPQFSIMSIHVPLFSFVDVDLLLFDEFLAEFLPAAHMLPVRPRIVGLFLLIRLIKLSLNT